MAVADITNYERSESGNIFNQKGQFHASIKWLILVFDIRLLTLSAQVEMPIITGISQAYMLY